MRGRHTEHTLKVQLARELCAIFDGYRREVAAGHLGVDASDLTRLRHGDLRRFSVGRILRYIGNAGYDIEIHLKKTPRLEEQPKPRRPTSAVVRYDYYGHVVPDSQLPSSSDHPL